MMHTVLHNGFMGLQLVFIISEVRLRVNVVTFYIDRLDYCLQL
jgi:hypothetical protein